MAKAVVDPESARVAGEVLVAERAAATAQRVAERMEGPRGGRLAVLYRALADVQLGELLASPLALVARADALGDRARSLRADSERERGELVRRLMAAELDLDDASLAAAALRYRAWQPEGPASTIAAAAQAALRDQAWTEVQTAVPVIMGALAGAAAECVSDSVRLAKGLPSTVVDDRSAFANRAHVEAWTRLRELVDRFVKAHEAADHLRAAGLAPGLSVGAEVSGVDWCTQTPAVYLRYTKPWRLPDGYGAVHPCLKLATAERAGAGPCLRGAGEADQAYWQRLRADKRTTMQKVLGRPAVV